MHSGEVSCYFILSNCINPLYPRMLFADLSLKCFDLEYVDEDQDRITISSEMETLEAIRVMRSSGDNILQLKVANVKACSESTSCILIDKETFRKYMDIGQNVCNAKSTIVHDNTLPKAECVNYRTIPHNPHCDQSSTTSTHIWRMRNTGVTRWPCHCTLIVKVSGRDVHVRECSVNVARVDPGEEVDIVMDIDPPRTPEALATAVLVCAPPSNELLLAGSVPVSVPSASPTCGEEEGEKGGTSVLSTNSSIEGSDHDHCDDPSDDDMYAEEVFEDFPSLVLDASSGHVAVSSSRLSENSDPVLVHKPSDEQHLSPGRGEGEGEVELKRREAGVDIFTARVLYRQQLAQNRASMWQREIAMFRSMGFQIEDGELQALLEEHLRAPESYSSNDLQLFTTYLLAHTNA